MPRLTLWLMYVCLYIVAGMELTLYVLCSQAGSFEYTRKVLTDLELKWGLSLFLHSPSVLLQQHSLPSQGPGGGVAARRQPTAADHHPQTLGRVQGGQLAQGRPPTVVHLAWLPLPPMSLYTTL